jgi:hypothetical protein
MKPSETIICTTATPLEGCFPADQMSQSLQQLLQKVERIIPDWPQSLRERLEDELARGEITEHGYNLRLAETYRHEQQSGEVPIKDIYGTSPEGLRLKFRVCEKFISVSFTDLDDMRSEKAPVVIPKIKLQITTLFPKIQFTDVISDKGKPGAEPCH